MTYSYLVSEFGIHPKTLDFFPLRDHFKPESRVHSCNHFYQVCPYSESFTCLQWKKIILNFFCTRKELVCFPLGTSLSNLRTWGSIRTWTHDIHHVFELSEEFISAGMKKEFDNLQYVLETILLNLKLE